MMTGKCGFAHNNGTRCLVLVCVFGFSVARSVPGYEFLRRFCIQTVPEYTFPSPCLSEPEKLVVTSSRYVPTVDRARGGLSSSLPSAIDIGVCLISITLSFIFSSY